MTGWFTTSILLNINKKNIEFKETEFSNVAQKKFQQNILIVMSFFVKYIQPKFVSFLSISEIFSK